MLLVQLHGAEQVGADVMTIDQVAAERAVLDRPILTRGWRIVSPGPMQRHAGSTDRVVERMGEGADYD